MKQIILTTTAVAVVAILTLVTTKASRSETSESSKIQIEHDGCLTKNTCASNAEFVVNSSGQYIIRLAAKGGRKPPSTTPFPWRSDEEQLEDEEGDQVQLEGEDEKEEDDITQLLFL